MALNQLGMSANHNTLLDVARLSMQFSGRYMQPYSHAKSPHKFTQAQLMTCLILRAYLKTTYRGVIEFLETSDELKKCLGLRRLPHYSTLKYFADRSDTLAIVDAILSDVVRQVVAQSGEADREVAIDSTGVESTAASAYFNTRRGGKRKRYVKLSLCVTCGTMLPASVVLSWGPCNDKAVARPLLDKTRAAIQPKTLFADAGYDAEWVHQYCRDDWQVTSWIPPAVHCKDGTVNGEYRSKMTPRRLKRNGYAKRWIVESFISGLKRTTGSMLNARKKPSLFVEAALRVLAYALRR
jgi:Transposase DDE domain